jgi:hypothetical protein
MDIYVQIKLAPNQTIYLFIYLWSNDINKMGKNKIILLITKTK